MNIRNVSSAARAIGLGLLLTVPQAEALQPTAPLERSITQRNAFNKGLVAIEGTTSSSHSDCTLQAQASVATGAGNNGAAVGWTDIDDCSGGTFAGSLELAAGGWYTVDLRAVTSTGTVLETDTVTKVGVGDIYITAGQSNSANHGQQLDTSGTSVTVDDRVSAVCLDGFTDLDENPGGCTDRWVLATDPQPNATRHGTWDETNSIFTPTLGEQASPWSRLGNHLVDREDVPIGFVSVGHGSTSVADWLQVTGDETNPNKHFDRLEAALDFVGQDGAKAVLWHQGENDCVFGIPEATYLTRLNQVILDSRDSSEGRWPIPWAVALASDRRHPNCTEARQSDITDAQRRVIAADPTVTQGATTDDLSDSIYRIGPHFTVAGLEQHSLRWAAALSPLAAPSTDISIANSSFQAPAMSGRGSMACNVYLVDWTRANSTASVCARRDGDPQCPNGGCDDAHYGVLPPLQGADGNQYLLIDYDTDISTLESQSAISQSSTELLAADRLYDLTVAVGNRDTPYRAYGGYEIKLLADDGSNTELVTAQSLIEPGPAGGFTDVNLSLVTDSTHPALNEPLKVELVRTLGRAAGNATTYADFDDVRLTVSDDSAALLGVGKPSFETPVLIHTNQLACQGHPSPWETDDSATVCIARVVDRYPTVTGATGNQFLLLDLGNADDRSSVDQVLTETLDAGAYYQLMVSVGHRDPSGTVRAFGGYTVELLAAEVVNGDIVEESILASVSSDDPPGGPGEFTDVTLRFKAEADDDRADGTLNLVVRLSKNRGVVDSTSTYVDFDNVRLVKVTP